MKILDVKVVPGKDLNSKWQYDMQIVTTDHGEFIDNMAGNNFIENSDYAIEPNEGFDWTQMIGKEVGEVVIYHSNEYDWINMPKGDSYEKDMGVGEKSDNNWIHDVTKILQSHRDSVKEKDDDSLEIIEVLQVKGSELNPRWKSDMQVIRTNKGEFIDNAVESTYKPGYDWSLLENDSIPLSSVYFNESNGYTWINRRSERY